MKYKIKKEKKLKEKNFKKQNFDFYIYFNSILFFMISQYFSIFINIY